MGLSETVKSLLQLRKCDWAWEHVIIDSSPEATQFALRELPSEWPLRHLVEPPRGIYSAMNSGIQQAQGDYLWFLNSGDLLTNHRILEVLLDRLDLEQTMDIVCAGVDRVRDGQYLYFSNPGKSFFWSTLGSSGVCHQGIIYRRQSLLRIGLYSTEFRQAADYEHHLRCIAGGLRIGMEPKLSLAAYDVGGISGQNYFQTFSEYAEIHKKLRGLFPAYIGALRDSYRFANITKIRCMKVIQESTMGAKIRKMWFIWKRRNDSNVLR